MSFEITGLSFSYGDHAVLEGVDLSVADGELACVLGPNGVGKTTLFRCILGLERPRAGTILVNGRPLGELTIAERAREMAFVPQSHAQVFDYEVLDVVLTSKSLLCEKYGIGYFIQDSRILNAETAACHTVPKANNNAKLRQ